MASRAKHEHRHRVISYSLSPRTPTVLRSCGNGTCTDIEVSCVLCEDDGNRRKHKKHHEPVTDRQVFNRALLLLTKQAVEYERLWGKPARQPACMVHGEADWYTGVSGNAVCGICHPATVGQR